MDLDRRIWMKRSICWTRASWASKTPNLSKTDSAFPVFPILELNFKHYCFKMCGKAAWARAGSWRPSPVWLFFRKILLTWSSGRKTRRSRMGLMNSTFSVKIFSQNLFLSFFADMHQWVPVFVDNELPRMWTTRRLTPQIDTRIDLKTYWSIYPQGLIQKLS